MVAGDDRSVTGSPGVPRPDGMIVAIDAGHQAVCFYRHYPQPVAAVRRHLPRPTLLRRWLAATDRLDPAEGGAVVLRCWPPIPTAAP